MTDAHTLTREQVIDLFEQIDTLREHIRQLEDALVPHTHLPGAWKLTAFQARLIKAIRAGGANGISHERAMLALYDLDQEAPDPQVIYVFLNQIKHRLANAGEPIVIERIPRFGWRMSPESCAAFDAAVAADQARWPMLEKAA